MPLKLLSLIVPLGLVHVHGEAVEYGVGGQSTTLC